MKHYGTVLLAMSLALAATGLAAGTETAVLAANGEEAPLVTNGWTPEVKLYVARLVASGVSNSGECPILV